MKQHSEDIVRRGVIGVVVREGRFLVIRRSQHVIAPGMFCFPGGGIEPGESDEQALVREMQEELAVDVAPVCLLWKSITEWRHALSWWLAELPPDAAPLPNPLEVESVHWHTADEIAAIEDFLPSNLAFLQALARGEFRLR